MKVVVTRHTSLVDYLRERGLIDDGALVIPRPSEEDVRGRHVIGALVIPRPSKEDVRGRYVIGVLPLHMAALAATITEVPLALTREDRGRKLSLERLREIAKPPRTYVVRDINEVRGGEVR